MANRLRTGIDVLDRKLDGGIPAGSIVVLSAQPASQAELFLYELTATRGTLWLSLDRTAESVIASIEQTPANTGDPTVRHISGEAPLDNAGKLVSALPETSNLIVDPLDVLEAQEPHSRFRAFMNDLQNHIVNTGSLAIVHCLDGRDVPPLRDTTEHFADVVFQLNTTTTGDEVENRLAIPKFRGGRAPTDIIKLNLVEEVSIDTSRDIA
ncbi:MULTISPECIES: RAD55 family ATPase [Haloarcula]|uniref:Transcriptional regulator n=8 Tax=Haloarcula TaxID=2237 RepID=A0A0N0BN12_9EURY|nr:MULTISPECIES: transcriptional regulator [Haloarcula]AEM57424.1 KaiC-like transcriptional regulator [Haloarcula hispanica ATCC 33960]AHB66189.1 transcriptional regulator [Haloarcula hispanica N601]AJF27312.1 transcriptional regulator [Haloarcula sp. CBA1115]EMA10295.1 KaiC-like transcriptional regulator [Haloarcula vallismortis ATCC 29715]EMA22583.1 KaiC-like transcriptional regulator [Haloarcula amylolytica JCM 13557]